MAAHVRLKNEFTEDEKNGNLMSWLYLFCLDICDKVGYYDLRQIMSDYDKNCKYNRKNNGIVYKMVALQLTLTLFGLQGVIIDNWMGKKCAGMAKRGLRWS